MARRWHACRHLGARHEGRRDADGGHEDLLARRGSLIRIVHGLQRQVHRQVGHDDRWSAAKGHRVLGGHLRAEGMGFRQEAIVGGLVICERRSDSRQRKHEAREAEAEAYSCRCHLWRLCVS
jgi:hypothetical protein